MAGPCRHSAMPCKASRRRHADGMLTSHCTNARAVLLPRTLLEFWGMGSGR